MSAQPDMDKLVQKFPEGHLCEDQVLIAAEAILTIGGDDVNTSDENDIPTYESEHLAKIVAAGLTTLAALRPYVEELWRRFDALKPGETIRGCTTKKEFCESILHRDPRTVRYMLNGGNPGNKKRADIISAPPDDTAFPEPRDDRFNSVITPKNIRDTRCLSMAKERLKFCHAKVELLAEAAVDPDWADKHKEIYDTLETYRQAFQAFAKFAADNLTFIEDRLALMPREATIADQPPADPPIATAEETTAEIFTYDADPDNGIRTAQDIFDVFQGKKKHPRLLDWQAGNVFKVRTSYIQRPTNADISAKLIKKAILVELERLLEPLGWLPYCQGRYPFMFKNDSLPCSFKSLPSAVTTDAAALAEADRQIEL